MIDTLIQDVRYALRTLRRSPGFTVTAVVILALGIGATTSMFSLLHATLFRSLPFPESDRLAAVYLTSQRPGEEVEQGRWSYPEFQALRNTTSAFESLAAFGAVGFNLTGGSQPGRAQGEVVSAGYFQALGAEPVLGRTFTPEEGKAPGEHPVAVISHAQWQERFGGDPEVLGREIRVNGVSLRVIGVMPRGFQGLTGPGDVWITHGMATRVTYPGQLTSHQHFLNVVGRLHEGTGLDAARAELESMASVLDGSWGGEHDAEARYAADVESLAAARVDPDVRRARLILFGAVLLLLLIAGADLAGLLLGRGLGRRRELAIRRALGSSRRRLVRQALTESTVLALLGGGVGVLLTLWVTELAAALMPATYTGSGYGRLAQFASISVDGQVLAFALGVSLLVGLAFGLGPALRATRPGADLSLRDRQARDGSAGSESWAFSAVVVTEFALALTLLVGAGLLLETLANMKARDGSFDARGVVTFQISPHQYAPEEGPALLERILERISTLPGVEHASVSPCAPFMSCATRMVRPSPEVAPDADWTRARRHYVGPEHFRTLGIDLLQGRGIRPSDGAGNPNVAVVNRHFAETFWPGLDPVGRELVFQGAEMNFIGTDSTATVVGVVQDVPFGGPDEPVGLDVYTSFRQFSWPFSYFLVRAERASSAAALVPDLRRAVRQVDPELPIFDVATVEERVDRALATPRFNGWLLGAFAALALVLAGVGIYGVMSQWVARRTREMGIRQAVGAHGKDVLGMVLARGLGLALSGVAVGAVGSFFAARALASQLYGVSPVDPGVFAAAAGFLTLVALLAVYLPARRATRVDPAAVLEGE